MMIVAPSELSCSGRNQGGGSSRIGSVTVTTKTKARIVASTAVSGHISLCQAPADYDYNDTDTEIIPDIGPDRWVYLNRAAFDL
jgi:hypothetical protein